jgi:hypothetical protein
MALIAVCAFLACILFLTRIRWECARPLPAELEIGPSRQIEDLWPLHTQHFPQLRQALAAVERRDMRRNASHQPEREWRQHRRDVLEGFLSGLAEDFARLGQIVQILETVFPLTPEQRREMDSSRVQFRLNYRFVALLIASRWMDPTRRLSRLTEILANMSAQLEAGGLPASLGEDTKLNR